MDRRDRGEKTSTANMQQRVKARIESNKGNPESSASVIRTTNSLKSLKDASKQLVKESS